MTTQKEIAHGQAGHLNYATLDQDSHVTGHGKHERVVATIPDHNGLYCRVDLKWGLPIPTDKQILKVARYYGDAKGRWERVSAVRYESKGGHDSIDYQFQHKAPESDTDRELAELDRFVQGVNEAAKAIRKLAELGEPFPCLRLCMNTGKTPWEIRRTVNAVIADCEGLD